MKKYKIRRDLKKEICGRTLYRIEGLININSWVEKGDLGGYIQKESNLSQEDEAWIYNDAKVYENAKVYGNAEVFGDAEVFGNARVCGKAKIYGNAKVYEGAKVYENTEVYGNAQVFGNAEVFGNALVYRDAKVCGEANLFGDVKVCGDTIENNKDIYNISVNDIYDITITPNFIRIGCEFHTKEEWWNFTDREIEAMDGVKAVLFWKKWKPILKAICNNN